MQLFFLLICCVSVSFQEPVGSPLVPSASPANAHYIPLYYADGLPAGYDIVDHAKITEQRANSGASNAFLSRLLGGNLLTPLNNLVTFTKTTTGTTVSVVTTAVFVNCIPVSRLSSTTACPARRRRHVDAALALDNNEDPAFIQPTLPEPLVASAIVDAALENREVLAEVESSKSEEPVEQQQSLKFDSPLRVLGGLTTTTTVTQLSTKFEFVPTTITRTKDIGAIDAALLCVPAGYVACPAPPAAPAPAPAPAPAFALRDF